MRDAFIQELIVQARSNPNIFLVVGDLGFSVVEPFEEEFPDRFLNAGIAEQNMTGVAAGLASEGYHVFTYSIANFPTLRCFEQIRNDVCYHNLPVTVVSVGGGVAYGSQGYSHHGLEDLAVMSTLPNMTVVAPGDPVEVRLALKEFLSQPRPSYLRLGKSKEPMVYNEEPNFKIGRAINVVKGNDAVLISTGGMLYSAIQVAGLLREKNINIGVFSMHTISPLDKDAIIEASQTGKVITLEEHGKGGLAAAVGEILAEHNEDVKFKSFYFKQNAMSVAGDQNYLREKQGLSVQHIADGIFSLFNKKGTN